MKFEYDPAKSETNKAKHGIDFQQAQDLWHDPLRLELRALSTTEPRFMIIAKRQNQHWSAIFTHRGSNIRIISVRRSRHEEIKQYEC